MSQHDPVLMKNYERINKYEPIAQEVELIEANPDCVHVKLAVGRETTVSIRHLARGDIALHGRDVDEKQQPSVSFIHQNERLSTGVPEISSKFLSKSTADNSQDNVFPSPSSTEDLEETEDE